MTPLKSVATREAIKRSIRGRVLRESADELVYRCTVSGDVDRWVRKIDAKASGVADKNDVMELQETTGHRAKE